VVFKFIAGAFGKFMVAIEAGNRKDYARQKAVVKEIALEEALSCNRCNSLALPLYSSVNKYKCLKCGRQFSGTSHYLDRRLERTLKSDMRSTYQSVVQDMTTGPS